MSKLVDSVVACQINNYVNRNKFNNYSNQHISLDIALLYIQNEVHLSLEHGESTVFILLDWSAAFDIADDSNLLDYPTSWFGVCVEEFIILGSPVQLKILDPFPPVNILENQLHSAKKVFYFTHHVSNIFCSVM